MPLHLDGKTQPGPMAIDWQRVALGYAAVLRQIASLPTRDANGMSDAASIDVLTGGAAINLARKALFP